jgi:hypothetical protein
MGRQVFSCRTYAKRGHHVVEVTGDVTFETIDSLRIEFANLRMQAPGNVVLDLLGVTMLSSVDNHCRLKVVCEVGHVLEVLEIAGITDMIALFPNLDMAFSG